jgi:hypothetical protein
MSTELLASALKALRSLADRAGTQLVEVRLIVENHAGAQQLADALQPEEERSSGVVGDVVSSQDAIQMWETGTDLERTRDLGGTLDGMRWQIDWHQQGGPTD